MTPVIINNHLHRHAGDSCPAWRPTWGRTKLHRPPAEAVPSTRCRRQVGCDASLDRADVRAARQTAERLQEDTAEFLPDGAVEDEVDSTVDVDEQVAQVR